MQLVFCVCTLVFDDLLVTQVPNFPTCSEFKMGNQIEDQQVSCLWQGSNILSVSLSGYINYLDINNPDKPLRVIRVRSHNQQLWHMSIN